MARPVDGCATPQLERGKQCEIQVKLSYPERVLTHLDIPVDQTEGVRESPQKLADTGPSPVGAQLLYQGGDDGWGKSSDGHDGDGGERAFGHVGDVL